MPQAKARGSQVTIEPLLAELGDAMRQARDLAARSVLMHDAALRCTHDHRLGGLQRGACRSAVAADDRFFDLANGLAQQRAARLVDLGPARDLARGFAGG